MRQSSINQKNAMILTFSADPGINPGISANNGGNYKETHYLFFIQLRFQDISSLFIEPCKRLISRARYYHIY